MNDRPNSILRAALKADGLRCYEVNATESLEPLATS
jgi:hypothetical protein